MASRDLGTRITIDNQAPFSVTFTFPGTLADATVGKARWYLNRNIEIMRVDLSVGTAPAGGPVTVDVNLNGTTIFTTQANRPSVAAAGFSDLNNIPDVVNGTAGDYLTADVDVAGTTTPGTDAVITVWYR